MGLIKVPYNLLKGKLGRRACLYYLLAKLAVPADYVLSAILSRVSQSNHRQICEPIFIIGLPRSGSTVLYQYLSCVLNVTYTNTIWSIFPRSTPFIKSILTSTPPSEFRSFYGIGAYLNSINEGKNLFNQWFSKSHRDPNTIFDHDRVRHLKAYFERVCQQSGRSWLIKDVRNCTRLQALSRIFPHARYIWLRRSPVQVAQSILIGRKTLKGSLEANWTIVPEAWNVLSKLPYSEQIAQQVFHLELQVERDLCTVPDSNVIEIDYSEFCANPFETAKSIRHKFPDLSFRQNIPKAILHKTFQASNMKRIAPEIYNRLESELQRLSEASDAEVVLHNNLLFA